MNKLTLTVLLNLLIVASLLLLIINKERFQTKNLLDYLPKKIKKCVGDKGPKGDRGNAGNNA
jgi:hypothetical protein